MESNKEDNIVSIKNLSLKIKDKIILNDITFDIKKGEILGLLGPNGAGKTSLMKVFCGLWKPTSGELVINNKNVFNNKNIVCDKIGLLIEETCAYENLSGYNNLKILARMYDKVSEEQINDIIKIVDLSESIHSKFKTYSLGMKKRLGIAMALLNNPNIIFLDEPTNGLDIDGRYQIKNLLKQLVDERNITVFISSHLTEDLEAICNRAIFIKKGQIISNINISDINESNLEEYYLKLYNISKIAD